MNRAEQAQQAELFRNKHRGPRLLLLPNAWDAMSARVFVAAGFDAIATTSGGVAWSLGYADGEQTPWKEVVAATARIVRAARVPVTADIEAGYGETPDAVMRSVSEIIEAGAVGVNLEDGTPHGPVPIRSPHGCRRPDPRCARGGQGGCRADRHQWQDRSLSAEHRRRSLSLRRDRRARSERIWPPGRIASIRSDCVIPRRSGGW